MENELVQRCKAGDLSAYEELFKLYGNKLYAICLRMSGDRGDAEDLMQEIFVILITKINAFRGDAKFSTWLHRIAVNTCISYLRRRKQPLSLEDQPEPVAGDPSQKAALQRAALKKAIAALPDGYRAVVILHDIQGFSHKEIGDILGISEGASKSQLFKARKKLREMIATPSSKQSGAEDGKSQVKP
jgi:RNA polymerase sigma-70 factor (ECF subfamily)